MLCSINATFHFSPFVQHSSRPHTHCTCTQGRKGRGGLLIHLTNTRKRAHQPRDSGGWGGGFRRLNSGIPRFRWGSRLHHANRTCLRRLPPCFARHIARSVEEESGWLDVIRRYLKDARATHSHSEDVDTPDKLEIRIRSPTRGRRDGPVVDVNADLPALPGA
jgi:hypothetical protein